MSEPAWLLMGRELRAIAQTGLTFNRDPVERRKYERIRELAAQLIADGARDDARRLSDLFSFDAGYGTPTVDVRAAVFSQGQVLLVRDRDAVRDGDGGWMLPGGWAEVDETPTDSVLRKVTEQSGLQARAVKLAAVHEYRQRHPDHHIDSIYTLFFIGELSGGARLDAEPSEIAFFPRHGLPHLSLGRCTTHQIDLMFRHAAYPDLATEFD